MSTCTQGGSRRSSKVRHIRHKAKFFHRLLLPHTPIMSSTATHFARAPAGKSFLMHTEYPVNPDKARVQRILSTGDLVSA